MPKSATVLEWVFEAARWSPSADNTQPWRFKVVGDVFEVWFSPSAHSFALEHPANLLSLGMLQENCEQMAIALGLSPEIVTAEPLSADLPVCTIRLGKEHINRLVSIEPPSLFLRHTNRLPYAKTALANDLHRNLSKCTEPSSNIKLLTESAQLSKWIPLIRLGSELRFQTREAHEWLDASLRMTEREASLGDGLDVSTFHLPPGGRALLGFIRDWSRMACLNRIGFYWLLAAIEASLVREAPGLLILSGKSGKTPAIDAGRTLARCWIELNHLGIAVQPYFVVPDQLFRLQAGAVSEGLKEHAVNLSAAVQAMIPDGDVLYMMLRIGYPKKTPVKSRRLPSEQLQYP
jgi:hypothetical protein